MNYFKKIETIVIVVIILVLGVVYGVLSQKAKAPTVPSNWSDSQTPGNDLPQGTMPEGSEAPANPSDAAAQSTPVTPAASQIKYYGQDGKNALQLLQTNFTVETQSFGSLGEFVKSINGIEPDASHFWSFYVNGKQAQVGASAYTTKAGEEIEWKLEKIQ